MATKEEAEEWLQYALDSEATAKNCGPLDPAFYYFMREAAYGLECAAKCEQGKPFTEAFVK
jgi:hypothetical protein